MAQLTAANLEQVSQESKELRRGREDPRWHMAVAQAAAEAVSSWDEPR